MGDVVAGVGELLGAERPVVPAGEAGRLGQAQAEHVVEQAAVAGLGPEPGEPGRHLGVEHPADLGPPHPAQQGHVLAPGVEHHLDPRVGQDLGQRGRVQPGVQRVDQLDPVLPDLSGGTTTPTRQSSAR